MQKTKENSLVSQAKQLYASQLKALLEPEHQGEYLAIEPDSGDYYLGGTISEAYEKAAVHHPGRKFFLIRVGHRAAISCKHRLSLWRMV